MNDHFVHQYPYSNFHELNADFLLKRLDDVEKSIKGIKEDIEGEVFAYVQTVLAPYEQTLNNLISQVNALDVTVTNKLNEYNNTITAFENAVNAQIAQIRADLINSINAVNSLTDTKIEQNNIYIIAQVMQNIGNVFTVIDPFTGDTVSIQEMVNTLAAFHITDGIDYATMNSRALTYAQFNALNLTYSQLLLHGNTDYI